MTDEHAQGTERTARLIEFYEQCRLEDQLGYYQGRCKEYRSAADQLALVSAAILGLTTFVSTFAAASHWGKSAFAILAVALPAISTALAGYGALYAFEQQRKLYSDAVRGLRKARAVEPTDPAAFADTVEGILANEQAQWGQLVGEIKPTV